MAKKPDFFAEHVNRLIAVSPCVFNSPPLPYPDIAVYLKDLREKGILFVPTTLSISDYDPVAPRIDCAKDESKDCEYEAGYPVASQVYWAQIRQNERFQEPIPLDQWLRGEDVSPLVPLDRIQTPTSLMVGARDKNCRPEMHEWMFHQIGTEEKYYQ